MSPKQATARAERIKTAQLAIHDVANANALKLKKAREHLTEL
jgi:hypothetical protein